MSLLDCECGKTFRSQVTIGPNVVLTKVCPHCGKPVGDPGKSPNAASTVTPTPATGSKPVPIPPPQVKARREAILLPQKQPVAAAVEPSSAQDLSAAALALNLDGAVRGSSPHSSDTLHLPSNWHRLSTAYGSSLGLHLVIGVILALLVIPTVLKPWREQVDVELSSSDSTSLIDAFDLDPSILVQAEAPGSDQNPPDSELARLGPTGDIVSMTLNNESPVNQPAISIGSADIKVKLSNPRESRPNEKAKSPGKRMPVTKLLRTAAQSGKGFNNPLLKSAEEGLVISDSAAAASKGVFSQLAGAWGGGGTGDGNGGGIGPGNHWHIWLLDASISLQVERQKLGDEVAAFYGSVARKDNSSRLDVSVVAFGQQTQSILDRTAVVRSEAGKVIGSRIKELPLDESGIENVMKAVVESLKLIPPNYKAKVSVVIWTDESGDDIEHLEETIAQCRQLNTIVHVVGPRSVFGMQPGLQRHTLPPPLNWELILPVTRGPDSAFPERVRLPLWYDSTDMPWSAGIPIASAMDSESLGGPLRCGLLAPTGPYALTRLALATGGTYTILDRHGDVPPPNSKALVKYAPDYRGPREIVADLEDHPLRRAVVESAALTWTQNFWPPQREFPIARHDRYPFRAYNIYMAPGQFAVWVGQRIQQDRSRLSEAANTLERALALLDSVPATALNEERGSPRWQAWYTLNRGLLMAHSVRIREFLTVTEPLVTPDGQLELMNNGINHLVLDESDRLQSDGVFIRRAGLARSLLEQVIQEHPDTPWSQLAKWELQHQFGFNLAFGQIPIPPPQNVIVTDQPAPQPTIPRL